MSKKCEICGKGPQYGNNVSKSKRRTNRRFLPNLQVGRVEVGGQVVRARVCTRCLKAHPVTS
ncbi:MAG: 50S ribosomal protein L28 [Candidatus Dormibacteraceae bacterium]